MGRKPKIHARRAVLSLRLAPEALARLRKEALKRNRSPSELAHYLIIKGLKELREKETEESADNAGRY
jgi:hypothetical protein